MYGSFTYGAGSFGTQVQSAYVPPINPPVGDTTAPVMQGAISAAALYGATISWQAATDNVAVTGYEISVDSGAPSWRDVGNFLSVDVSGLSAGTMYTVRVRAYDAAGNRCTPLVSQLVIAGAIVPIITGTVTYQILPRNWKDTTIRFA